MNFSFPSPVRPGSSISVQPFCMCGVCSPGHANLSSSSTKLLNACVVDGKSLINTNSICAFSFFVSQQSVVSGRKNSEMVLFKSKAQ